MTLLAPAMAAEAGSSGSTILGFLGLAGIVLVAWLWRKATSAASRKVNRAVFRGTHREGQRATRQGLALTASHPAEEVLDAVVTVVNAHAAPPPVVGGLYLAGRDAHEAQFVFGSKLGTSFRTRVRLADTESGCAGTFDVLTWTERDGLVEGREQLDRVRDRVAGAVRGIGGEAHVTEPQPQPQPGRA